MRYSLDERQIARLKPLVLGHTAARFIELPEDIDEIAPWDKGVRVLQADGLEIGRITMGEAFALEALGDPGALPGPEEGVQEEDHSMSFEITTAMVQQYNDNVVLLQQQKPSRLRPCVREEGVQGEYGFFDQIDMSQKEYLGDSVYAAWDGNGVILTTENGLPGDPSNEIYIEDQVWKALKKFVDRIKRGEI